MFKNVKLELVLEIFELVFEYLEKHFVIQVCSGKI